MAPLYQNFYQCATCGTAWDDAWCAQCDDDCPACGTTMTPRHSADTGEDCGHPGCRPDLTPGATVLWLRTMGGGGGSGHRPNPKEEVPSTVLVVHDRRVKILPADRAGRASWVRPTSLRAP